MCETAHLHKQPPRPATYPTPTTATQAPPTATTRTTRLFTPCLRTSHLTPHTSSLFTPRTSQAGCWTVLWGFMFFAMTVYALMVPDTLGWGLVSLEASFGLLRFSFVTTSIFGAILVAKLFTLWDPHNVTEAWMEFSETKLLSFKKARAAAAPHVAAPHAAASHAAAPHAAASRAPLPCPPRTSPLTSHLSPLTSHFSPLTSHPSPLTSHLSPLHRHLCRRSTWSSCCSSCSISSWSSARSTGRACSSCSPPSIWTPRTGIS